MSFVIPTTEKGWQVWQTGLSYYTVELVAFWFGVNIVYFKHAKNRRFDIKLVQYGMPKYEQKHLRKSDIFSNQEKLKEGTS